MEYPFPKHIIHKKQTLNHIKDPFLIPVHSPLWVLAPRHVPFYNSFRPLRTKSHTNPSFSFRFSISPFLSTHRHCKMSSTAIAKSHWKKVAKVTLGLFFRGFNTSKWLDLCFLYLLNVILLVINPK